MHHYVAPGSPEAAPPADPGTPPGSPEASYPGSPVYTGDAHDYPRSPPGAPEASYPGSPVYTGGAHCYYPGSPSYAGGYYDPGSPEDRTLSEDEASDATTGPRDDGPPTPTHGPGTPDYAGADPSATPEVAADPGTAAPAEVAATAADAPAEVAADPGTADPTTAEAAATPCGCPLFVGDSIRKACARFDDCGVCREDKKLGAGDRICPECFNAVCSECYGEMDKLVDEWGDPRPWRCPHCRSYRRPLLLGSVAALDFCEALFKGDDKRQQFSSWIRAAMQDVEADASRAGYDPDILAKKWPEHWFSNPPADLRHLDEVPAVTSPEYTQFAAWMFARWVIVQTYSAARSKVYEHQKRLADTLEYAEELRVTADAREQSYHGLADTLAVRTEELERLEAKDERQAELLAAKEGEIKKLKASLSAQKGLVTTHKNRAAKAAEVEQLTISKLKAKLARAEALLPKDTCQLCGEEVPRGLKHSPIERLCTTDDDVCSLDYTFEKFLERLVPEAMAAAVALYVHIVTAVLTNIAFEYTSANKFEAIDSRRLMDWQSRIKDPQHSLLEVLDTKALNSTYGLSALVCAALTAECAGSGDGDDVTLLEIHRRALNIYMHLPGDPDVRKVDNEYMTCFLEWVVPGRADHPPDDGDPAFSIALADDMDPVDSIDDFILGRLKLGSQGHFLSVAPFGPHHGGWFSADGRDHGTAEAFLVASGGVRRDGGCYDIWIRGKLQGSTHLKDFGFDAYNGSRLGVAYSRFNSLLVDAVHTLVEARRGSYIELRACQLPDCKHLIDLNDHDTPFSVVAGGVRHPWCTDTEVPATVDAQLTDGGSQKRRAAAEDSTRKRVCIDLSEAE